jgi:death on curing protein
LLNGAILHAEDWELYPQYLGLAEGTLSETDFCAWLRQQISSDSGNHVHEERAPYAR